MFNIMYSMNGGITYTDIGKMPKRRFVFFMERLAEQKKKENDAIERARKGSGQKSKSGIMKYLGR